MDGYTKYIRHNIETNIEHEYLTRITRHLRDDSHRLVLPGREYIVRMLRHSIHVESNIVFFFFSLYLEKECHSDKNCWGIHKTVLGGLMVKKMFYLFLVTFSLYRDKKERFVKTWSFFCKSVIHRCGHLVEEGKRVVHLGFDLFTR